MHIYTPTSIFKNSNSKGKVASIVADVQISSFSSNRIKEIQHSSKRKFSMDNHKSFKKGSETLLFFSMKYAVIGMCTAPNITLGAAVGKIKNKIG